jgi:SAM-dependent methyltransferase
MVPEGYYDRVADWCRSERYAREIEELLDRLDLPRGSSLLDIGCGTGEGMTFASRRGLRVVGVDKPQDWARHCLARPVVRADAARLPFRSASFDGVLLFHVLAHLVAVEICLAEINRVLRAGGRLAVSTPNADYLDALNAAPVPDYVPDPTIRGHFASAELTTLLETSGFTILHASTFDPSPALSDLPGERLFFVAERNGHGATAMVL